MDAPTSSVRQFDCRGRGLRAGGDTAVFGILNLTPDSFSDGGKFADAAAAVSHARRMVAEGAEAIDLGGQSTRPGYVEISPEEEMRRVLPVLTALLPHVAVPLSIDTYRAVVARAALEAGAHLVNDVRALQGDPEMASVVRDFNCPVVVMHQDESFRENPCDVVAAMKVYFEKTCEIADRARVPLDRMIIDPGIGFFKSPAQSLEIMKRLPEVRSWGWPVMLGVSRKSVIGHVLDLPTEERLEGTLALTAVAAWLGIEYVRVHDVQANVRAARMASALRLATPKS